MKKGKIVVVGIGPGDEKSMTDRAGDALRSCEVIAGYKTYLDLVRETFPKKEFLESGMRQELQRCRDCLALAKEGKNVALICSGDAGVYGMASPMLEVAAKEGFEDVEIIPGVTAALSGAALLGAPIGHDFCVISLSDLLTPQELIEERLKHAALADLCIVLYNPASHARKEGFARACEILLQILPPDLPCGVVRNIGRAETKTQICTLGTLSAQEVDMVTTVFIGNSKTKRCGKWMVTPRGYEV